MAVMLPSIGALAIGYGFLRYSLTAQIEALVREELSEATLRSASEADSLEGFAAIAAECQREHPDYPMFWRIWDSHSHDLLQEAGAEGSIRLAPPAREPIDEIRFLEGGFATSATPLGSGRVLALVIDEEHSDRILQRYLYAAIGVLVITLVLAIGFGSAASRRVRRLFANVARDVRPNAEPDPSSADDLERLPNEVDWIARGLRASLAAVRKESSEAVLFTMCLAHELRSPIQNLIGQTEVALMNAPDATADRTVLQHNLDESLRFCDAVDNLLSVCASMRSRSTEEGVRDSLGGSKEKFDLFAEAQLRLQREIARGQRKDVRVELTQLGECSMHGDREAAIRGLRNIVANAVDWSPSGCPVLVEFVETPASIRIAVEDDGPGIPDEIREKVFEPFFRGETNGVKRAGFGLGLAMAKEAARLHAGSIRIETRDGGGTRVVLELRSGPE